VRRVPNRATPRTLSVCRKAVKVPEAIPTGLGLAGEQGGGDGSDDRADAGPGRSQARDQRRHQRVGGGG
jgi:hypothetical protein